MGQLIKFEFQKIIKKKIVIIGLVLLVLLNLSLYTGFGPGNNAVHMPDDTYTVGRQAIPLDKEITSRYAGQLTDETVQRVLADFPRDLDGEYNFIYYSENSIYDTISRNFANGDGTWNNTTVQQMFPGVTNLEVGYNDGWASLLSLLMYVMSAAGFLLIVALSPIFAEEYTRGTDALILTSRYGKKQCAKAKILAAMLFSLLLGILFIGINTAAFTSAFGVDGWNASVQISTSYLFDHVPYNLTFGQAFGFCALLWFSGLFVVTGLCLLFSSVSKSSFIALIITLFVYAVPMFISVSEQLPLKLMALNPLRAMMIGSTLSLTQVNMGGTVLNYCWVIALFMVFVVALVWFLARRFFAKHQVVS